MIMMLYFIVAEWFFCVIKLRVTPLYTVMFALIITAVYLARVYISRLPVYLAVHFAMWAAIIIIPLTTAYKVSGIVALLIFTICDLFFWTSGMVRSFSMVHPVGVSVFLLVFIYASFYGDAFLIKESYVCGILFAAACFVRTYLLNAVKFSTDIQPGSNAPEDEIFRNNGRTVCVLVTLFTLLMFFIQSDTLARGIRALIRLVYAGMRSFLIFLLSLLQKGAEHVTEEGAKAGMMFDPGPYKSL
ncbi:MAG: hypothetical protein K5857_02385, partial [Lachnospiraceae bacterium]|nr:hypothetical protein [Lachnospiraceae bacterium]